MTVFVICMHYCFLLIQGESIKPQKTIWPLDALKKRRMAQNQLDNYQEGEAVQGLEYCEEEIPTVSLMHNNIHGILFLQ